MSSLIPEKRVNKNGIVSTKHVRATPKARNDTSGVPAPVIASADASKESKGAQKPYKPRPAQKEQKHRNYDSGFANYNEKLKTPDEHSEKWGRSITFLFTASDVEMYEVLSVAGDGDAIRLLAMGIRNADDAVAFMRSKGAEESIIDRKVLAEGALERGISAGNFILRLPESEAYDSTERLDALELYSISSLSGQSYRLLRDVLQKKIKVADIKYLGASKLKSHDRLISTAPALMMLNETDPPFTLDDLKMLVERAAKESAKMPVYRDVLDYVMQRGVGILKEVETLKFFSTVLSEHRKTSEGYDEAEYEVAFYKEHEWGRYRANSTRLMKLRDAGVSPEDAAHMIDQGMTDLAIIGVSQEGTEKPFAEGWL
jgi:hypothetical protein